MKNPPIELSPARNRLKRGRPPIDAAVRHEAIMLCAEEAFMEQGYSHTSMDEVATRARISKRTIYKYFPNKRELFRSVIAEHRVRIINVSRIERDESPLNETLYKIFLADQSTGKPTRRLDIFQLAFNEAAHNPEIRDIMLEAGRRPAVLSLAEWFESQGLFRGRDQEQLASILLDMVLAFVTRKDVFEMSSEAYVSHVKQRVDVFLDGVFSKGRSD